MAANNDPSDIIAKKLFYITMAALVVYTAVVIIFVL